MCTHPGSVPASSPEGEAHAYDQKNQPRQLVAPVRSNPPIDLWPASARRRRAPNHLLQFGFAPCREHHDADDGSSTHHDVATSFDLRQRAPGDHYNHYNHPRGDDP